MIDYQLICVKYLSPWENKKLCDGVSKIHILTATLPEWVTCYIFLLSLFFSCFFEASTEHLVKFYCIHFIKEQNIQCVDHNLLIDHWKSHVAFSVHSALPSRMKHLLSTVVPTMTAFL